MYVEETLVTFARIEYDLPMSLLSRTGYRRNNLQSGISVLTLGFGVRNLCVLGFEGCLDAKKRHGKSKKNYYLETMTHRRE
jgi:hypothetical protein